MVLPPPITHDAGAACCRFQDVVPQASVGSVVGSSAVDEDRLIVGPAGMRRMNSVLLLEVVVLRRPGKVPRSHVGRGPFVRHAVRLQDVAQLGRRCRGRSRCR